MYVNQGDTVKGRENTSLQYGEAIVLKVTDGNAHIKITSHFDENMVEEEEIVKVEDLVLVKAANLTSGGAMPSVGEIKVGSKVQEALILGVI